VEKIKKIAIVIIVLMALTMFFGCTGTEPIPDSNTPKVTTQDEASAGLNDASTGLSGVKQTLDDIDNTLTE